MGKADDPLARWSNHCAPVKTRTHKSNWIAELRALGLTPELEILEEIPMEGWQEIEREYIRVFRMIGIRLTNISDGGDGGGGSVRRGKDSPIFGRKRSREEIEKSRIARTGIRRTPEQIEAMSGKNHPLFGKHHTQEHRDKISASNLGRVKSVRECKNISEGKKGIPLPRATLEKAWAAVRGTKQSSETIALRVAKNTGKFRSEDTKQKMRDAWVKRKALQKGGY